MSTNQSIAACSYEQCQVHAIDVDGRGVAACVGSAVHCQRRSGTLSTFSASQSLVTGDRASHSGAEIDPCPLAMPSGFAEAMSACSATALHQDLEVALDQIAVQRSDRPTCPIVDRPTVIEVDALGAESSVTAVRIENERGAGAASTQSGPAIFPSGGGIRIACERQSPAP